MNVHSTSILSSSKEGIHGNSIDSQVVAVSVARRDRALSTTALFGLAALVWLGATLTGVLEVVAAIDLRNVVEGEAIGLGQPDRA